RHMSIVRSGSSKDVQASADPIGDEDEAIRADQHVVELDRLLAGGRVRHIRGDLRRMKRVAGVVDPQPGVEVRRENDAVARERPWPVLVQVVRTEAESTRAVVANRDGESRDLSRASLVRNVYEVDVLARAFAAGLDGLVGDDEELSVPER